MPADDVPIRKEIMSCLIPLAAVLGCAILITLMASYPMYRSVRQEFKLLQGRLEPLVAKRASLSDVTNALGRTPYLTGESAAAWAKRRRDEVGAKAHRYAHTVFFHCGANWMCFVFLDAQSNIVDYALPPQ